MNKTETRTVLLARPGEARAQLQAALEQVGLDLVLVADPLEIEQAQVLSLRPNNLVMVMDAEVEEVLERFDDLLVLDDCRILFEEAELVAARAGWDVARWSRHLSAKLLGHGDVLPAGHEMDAATIKPAVSQQDDAKAIAEDRVAVVEADPAPAAWLEIEPAIDAVTGEQVPADLPPVLQPIADSEPQAVIDHPMAAEAPEVMAATSASAVSDYADYDDLDAFSFLDQEAIAAAQARDAEAAAIREAEAAAEAALRTEQAATDLSMDYSAWDAVWPEQQNDIEPVATPVPVSPEMAPELAARLETNLETPLDAGMLEEYDQLDDISFLNIEARHTAEPGFTENQTLLAEADTPSATALPSWDISAQLNSTALSSEQPADANADTGDWSIYQDFEAIADLPDTAFEQQADTQSAAAAEPSEVPYEEAFQRITDDLNQFEPPQAQDGWQDFERPEPESQAPSQADTESSVKATAKNFETLSQWSLSDISLTIDEGKKRPAFDNKRLNDLEQRISSLALVKTEEEIEAEARQKQHEGAVLVIGGIGGPDPLRHILQQLPKDFPVPVLVQQWLDAGSYDRLQRQMERVSAIPIVLAVPGMEADDGTVYIVPPGVGLSAEAGKRLRFTQVDSREFANLLDALPSISSVAVLLSGASDAFVEPLLRFQQSGGKLLAQCEEGCYDHSMPALMASRGAQLDTPAGIAARIKALWSTTELK
ncbi:hypothetical protein CO609_05980 [Lysobacteraceae bacterium NML91-0268]|nr:hypothetical protein CO609_05980 [Xanthomonadaceae bacterium NML91-0268]